MVGSEVLEGMLVGGGSGGTRNGEGLGAGTGRAGGQVWGKDLERGFKGAPELRQVLGRMGARWGSQVGWCASGIENPMHLSLPLPPGGSTWQPSSTSAACTTQLPARRSWPWPGTWNCLRGEPCHPLGTVPSSQTSPCPAHLSASASLSSWAAFPSPGWPGLVWPVCPGFGLCLHHGPLPNAETLPALHLNAPHLCC